MANGNGTKTDARTLARLRALPHDHPTRVKSRARSRAWNAANPRKVSEYDRTVRRDRESADPNHKRKIRGAMLRRYGLTIATWDALFERQGRACAICRVTETPDGRWHTDHDDTIGMTAVRGILCVRCNIGIGQLDHNRDRLEAAILYLNRGK